MKKPLQPNVLFLEDDADTRELVKFSLERSGINVISAETVGEAWIAAVAYEIDLFLLDGLIPHGDSLKLCRDLRTFAPAKPIVFYSGLAYEADIKKGMEAGADGYIVKPFHGDLAREVLAFISHESSSPTAVAESVSFDEVTIDSREIPMPTDRKRWPEVFETAQALYQRRPRGNRMLRNAGGII